MENHFYKDKVCVVTGAASGIGLATVKKLIEEEAIVYALDNKAVNWKSISVDEFDLKPLKCLAPNYMMEPSITLK